MNTKEVVEKWFEKWEKGDYLHLPITDDFRHISPFGTIDGKEAYLALVSRNEDKFLGQTFILREGIYENERACVRYTARQGDDFTLEVSEWYHFDGGLIREVIAYYHIGEIRKDRELELE